MKTCGMLLNKRGGYYVITAHPHVIFLHHDPPLTETDSCWLAPKQWDYIFLNFILMSFTMKLERSLTTISRSFLVYFPTPLSWILLFSSCVISISGGRDLAPMDDRPHARPASMIRRSRLARIVLFFCSFTPQTMERRPPAVLKWWRREKKQNKSLIC